MRSKKVTFVLMFHAQISRSASLKVSRVGATEYLSGPSARDYLERIHTPKAPLASRRAASRAGRIVPSKAPPTPMTTARP